MSASNDHTTRFWSRERPGDASSVFSGGGEKPPEVLDAGGLDEEEEAMMVPGFSYGGGASGASGAGAVGAGGGGGDWWGKEEEAHAVGFGGGGRAPFLSATFDSNSAYGRRETSDDIAGDEFVIPGFGVSENSSSAAAVSLAGRQSGPLPSQEDLFGTGGDEWSRGSGPGPGAGAGRGGRGGSRWGPRRVGGGSRY